MESVKPELETEEIDDKKEVNDASDQIMSEEPTNEIASSQPLLRNRLGKNSIMSFATWTPPNRRISSLSLMPCSTGTYAIPTRVSS